MAPDPNWKKNVREALRERRAKNGRTNTVFGRELRPLQLTAALKYVQIIDAASAALGVNRSTFVRRAAAVAAADVLSVNVRDILWHCPAPDGFRAQRMRVDQGGARDSGDGIEKWCAHPGCDGAHLRG